MLFLFASDGGDHGGLKEVRINPCDSEPCVFHKGTSPTIEVDFKAPNDSPTLTASLTANIAGMEIPAPGFDKDACNNHGIPCPVKANQQYTYSYTMLVNKAFPNIDTIFTLSVSDTNDDYDLCFKLPVQVR